MLNLGATKDKRNLLRMRTYVILAVGWILIAVNLSQAQIGVFYHLLPITDEFIWTGLAGDNNWNTPDNWSVKAVPGPTHVAKFKGGYCSGVDCNALININVNVKGVVIDAAFGGTITQGAGQTLALGEEGWLQDGGTFAGSVDMISVTNGPWEVTGGNFSHGGLLKIGSHDGAETIRPGTGLYTDVEFNFLGWASRNFQAETMIVAGDLILSAYTSCGVFCSLNNGTIQVAGDVFVVNGGARGTAVVKLAGSTDQSIDTSSAAASGFLPGLQIASTGGIVHLLGTVQVSHNYVFTSGDLNAGTSTLKITGPGTIIQPGSVTYNNVEISSEGWITKNLQGETMDIQGHLTLSASAGCSTNCRLNNGILNVQGNLSIVNDGYRGDAILQLVGSANSTISAISGIKLPSGTLTINKDTTATTVTLLGAVVVNSTGQDLILTQGTLNLAGFDLTVNDTLMVDLAGKLVCNGGVPTFSTFIANGEVICGTSVGISWTGLVGDNNWNTPGNWSGNVAPTASDTALFTSVCSGAQCNANTSTSLNIRGLNLQATYPGTITQNSGHTITIGAFGWNQLGGSFAGSDSAITVSGPYLLSGGSFKSTSDTFTMAGHFTISGSPAFNANSGTFHFTASSTITPGTVNFNNVLFTRTAAVTYNLNNGTMNIDGDLTVGITSSSGSRFLNSGILRVKGNVDVHSYGLRGSALIQLIGTTPQTVTGSGIPGWLPGLEIASSSTVTLSGSLYIMDDYLYTSGNLVPPTHLKFGDELYGSGGTIRPGNFEYNDVTFGGYGGDYELAGTMKVNGTLTFNDRYGSSTSINTGTIEAKGDVFASPYGFPGTGLVKLVGTIDQTVTGVSNAYFPSIEVASSAKVTFVGSIRIHRNFTYTSGTVDFGTSAIVFDSTSTTNRTIRAPSLSFYDLKIGGYNSTTTLTDSFNVMGNLTLADTYTSGAGSVNGSTIFAYGDVAATNSGLTGTTLIRVSGSSPQQLSGTSNSYYPSLEIASSSTVSYSGTLRIGKHYTVTSGTIASGTSTVIFKGSSALLTVGSENYNNVSFDSRDDTQTLAGNITVNGDLTFVSNYCSSRSRLNGGTVIAKGNVVFSTCGYQGNSPLSLEGATSTTIQMGTSAYGPQGTWTVNKPAAAVTLLSNLVMNGTGQDLDIVAGTVDMAGYNLTVNDAITNNGVLRRGTNPACGILSYGGSYTGAAPICP